MVQDIVQAAPRGVVLDAGCGTGDLMAACARQSEGGLKFVGLDLSIPMMRAAHGKVKASSLFIQADCGRLPLLMESVDAVMSAFVLRNVRKIIPEVLREVLRVLKPGGEAFLLEMTVPDSAWLRVPHRLYLRSALPAIGRAVFGRRWSGSYLKDTILQFWKPEEFSRILRSAGFREASFKMLTGGLAVLHRCKK